MKKKRLLIIALVIAMLLPITGLHNGVEALQKEPFSDLINHWSREYVLQLTEKGIFQGYADGTFKPNNNITVAEFIKIVVVAMGHDLRPGPGDRWYIPFKQKAEEIGLIQGNEIGYFEYTRPITRGEMARILVRATGDGVDDYEKFIDNYVDYTKIPTALREYVLKATALGLIQGYEDSEFKADKNATRAEASTMITRLIEPDRRAEPIVKKGYRHITEFERELLSKYVSEDQGALIYRVDNAFERVEYVYKIASADLPVRIGNHILYSIEPEIEIVGTGKNPSFIVYQSVEFFPPYRGLYLNVANKDYSRLRNRNGLDEWTPRLASIPLIDQYGNQIYKTFYPVISSNDKDGWQTYRGEDSYHLIFNDTKNNYAVIVENAFNQ
ncbi:S-layer homology domain-containing protein [Alkaliphilus crotonatoxidans]